MRRILVKCVGMRKRGEASRLKLTQIDPNAPKMNVYNDLNIARKDEGERARGGPTGLRPHLVRCDPVLLESSSSVFLFLGIWVLWSTKGKKSMGEKRKDI